MASTQTGDQMIDYETVHCRLRAIAERLKNVYGAKHVILYGSYPRYEATRDSDIDLLIVADSDKRFSVDTCATCGMACICLSSP